MLNIILQNNNITILFLTLNMSDNLCMVPVCVGSFLAYLTDSPLFTIMGIGLGFYKNSFKNNMSSDTKSSSISYIMGTSTLLVSCALGYAIYKKTINFSFKFLIPCGIGFVAYKCIQNYNPNTMSSLSISDSSSIINKN